MKEQNPDIPFIVKTKSSRANITFLSEDRLDGLILDPRGMLSCLDGLYGYTSKNTVVNAARVLRDERKLASNKALVLWFTTTPANDIDVELGKAIEAMAAEIKTLEEKRK